MATHEVTNQPPPLHGYNVFTQDHALTEGMTREGAGWAEDRLRALGERAGTPEAIAWGSDANTHPPVLRTHDRFGNRIDQVDYHPSYHQLMTVAVGARAARRRLAWRAATGRGATSPERPGSMCGARSTPGTAARSP